MWSMVNLARKFSISIKVLAVPRVRNHQSKQKFLDLFFESCRDLPFTRGAHGVVFDVEFEKFILSIILSNKSETTRGKKSSLSTIPSSSLFITGPRKSNAVSGEFPSLIPPYWPTYSTEWGHVGQTHNFVFDRNERLRHVARSTSREGRGQQWPLNSICCAALRGCKSAQDRERCNLFLQQGMHTNLRLKS